jgi:hypothetical protein
MQVQQSPSKSEFAGAARKAYVKPGLVCYGGVGSLTQAGTQQQQEMGQCSQDTPHSLPCAN